VPRSCSESLGGAPGCAAASCARTEGPRSKCCSLYLGQATTGPDGWEHIRTVLRAVSAKQAALGRVSTEERYFIASLPSSRLTSDQWLLVVRRHWGVDLAQTQTIKSHCGSRCDGGFPSPFVVREAAA
jgi:hypothetical protein